MKKAPEDTNKRWHYERAEKKRALFYEELVEESKEWKEWRTKKLAEKASEAEEDQLDVESDDEEDVEVVQQVQNAQSPERPPRKGKLRRYSGTEGEDSDAAAVSVTSEKRYATPPPPGQRNGARTSGVVVEVPSPSRQRTKEREQLLQVGTAQAEETKSAAKNASSEHPLKGSGTNKTSAASLTNAIPDEVTNMVFQADEAIAQRQSLTQTGQSGRDLSSNMTPQGVSVKQSLPQPGPVTTLDDDSGSEDSRAEVTDDDAAQDGQTRFRPASQPSERGQPDLQEDSFRAEMISPVPQSQEGRARGSSGLSLESSLEEIQPDLSLYHIQHPAPGPKDSNSITVKKVKEVLGEKAKEVLGEKAPLHKRQHSRDSDGPSSPSKMETSHTSKRSRTDASVPRHAPYNPSRRIMQSPSPELEDPRDTHQRSQQPSGRTNHLPGGTHHPPSISNRPASSSGGRHIHHISDGEPDIIEVSDRSSTNASQPFSSQPVKHSIREKLQRPRWP